MYEPYEAFKPDILLGGGQAFDREPFGVSGQLIHTPGHTSGSLSVVSSDGQRLVGDVDLDGARSLMQAAESSTVQGIEWASR